MVCEAARRPKPVCHPPELCQRPEHLFKCRRPGVSPASPRGAAFRSVGMAEAAHLLLVGGAGGSELYTRAQALGLLFQN